MRMSLACLLVLFAALVRLPAQPASDATHNELRALRDGLLDAINKGDVEKQMSFLHPDVVITWHSAEVSRGRDGVRKYYHRMTSGADKVIENYHAEVTVDELTALHGETTGIAFGSAIEQFKLVHRAGFELNGRWTATLVKENGRWLVAAVHLSSNLFDNTVLNLTRKSTYWVGGISLVGGLLAGFFVGRSHRSSSKS